VSQKKCPKPFKVAASDDKAGGRSSEVVRTNFLELPSTSVAWISFAGNVTVTDVISVIAAL
jgi:hypothetical protein